MYPEDKKLVPLLEKLIEAEREYGKTLSSLFIPWGAKPETFKPARNRKSKQKIAKLSRKKNRRR